MAQQGTVIDLELWLADRSEYHAERAIIARELATFAEQMQYAAERLHDLGHAQANRAGVCRGLIHASDASVSGLAVLASEAKQLSRLLSGSDGEE